MKLEFIKMHGAGNDYIYIDMIENEYDFIDMDISDVAIKLSDRHFGIGSDGIVLIYNSNIADFKMRMFNSDGSEGEMCGNAVRCISKYVYEKGYTNKEILTIETLSGIKKTRNILNNGKVIEVGVDMGEPILDVSNIPVIFNKDRLINEEVLIDDEKFKITCVSMGNPHAVIFTNNIDNICLEKMGAKIENNKIFPKRVNVEFVEIIDENTLKMRVWERGSGETMSCGTGASAVAVASVLNNYTEKEKEILIKLKGGEFKVVYSKENRVFLRGPVEYVYDGIVFI